MSKIATAASFQAIIDGADEKTDFKKQLQAAINALGANEVIIVNLNTAAESATTSINDFTIQVKTLNETVKQLTLEIEDKDEQLIAATDAIEEISKRLDLIEKNSDGPLIVSVGNTMKKLLGNNFSFTGESKPLTAKELSERPDLLEQMLAKGSGALVDAEDSE